MTLRRVVTTRSVRRGWSRLARAGVNALLVLASVSLVGGLAELVTRLVSTSGPSLLVMDEIRGKHWTPGHDADVFVPEAGRRVRLRFHRDGFRGPERPYRKPPGVRRIVVLGDSMVAAVAVDEPLTLVGRLEALLDRDQAAGAPGVAPRVEVMNFGVSSASTGQELVTYRQVARRYRPDDVVVAFNAGNDLADNCSCLSRAHRLYFDLAADGRLVERRFSPPAPALGAWLDRHSHFYVWQKEALARLRAAARERRRRLEPGAEVFRADHAPPVELAWRISAALLAALAAETAADGARLAVVLIPAPEELYDDLWQELLRRAGSEAGAFDRRQPARRVAAIAAGLGVPFLDLGQVFRETAVRRDSTIEAERVFFGGRYHLNEQGNRLAAEAVRRWLDRSSDSRSDGRPTPPRPSPAGTRPRAGSGSARR